MLRIPRTNSIQQLEENVAAASLELSHEQVSRLDQLTGSA
jgi:aryl-alcohol dehydrogenase-like predicted oxidoreductase